MKANADPLYQQLRQLGKNDGDFGGAFATVSNLVLTRDAAVFTLHNGEIYFTEVMALRFCIQACSFEPSATGRSLP